MEFYKEIYTQDPGENPRPTTREDDSEVRLKRIFKRRFRDLAHQLVGSKIQGIVQLVDLEGLEKELDTLVRKILSSWRKMC